MKIRNYIITGLVLLSLLPSAALADRAPKPGAADARIKSYIYYENEVYYLKGHYGFTMVIEFSPKEKVESISIGDSEAWQVLPGSRKNLIYIKPLEQNAETNMTVLTSKRIYTFELAAAKASSPKAGDLTFRVKFRYPDEESLELANFSSKTAGSYDPLQGTDTSGWNFDYSYSGSKSLRPKRVFDDGTFTYFEFKKPDVTPAIFSVDEKGNESLVNFNMEGSYMIVNSTKRQFTLRDGDTATCIFNDAYPKSTGKQTAKAPIEEVQENIAGKKASRKKTAKAQISSKPDTSGENQILSETESGDDFDLLSYFQGNKNITLNN